MTPDYGDMPLELAAALMEPDLSAAELLERYGADKPSMPGRAGWALAAYRGLAESRNVPLADVLDAVRNGKLGDIIRLPEIEDDNA